MTKGILSYNSYGLLVMDMWEIDGFHCGDTLEVWDSYKQQWIPTRMEMNYQAPSFFKTCKEGCYLVGTPYSGTALEGLLVRVNY